jgi:hypothetical protein
MSAPPARAKKCIDWRGGNVIIAPLKLSRGVVMPSQQKMILQMLCKYAEIVNLQFDDVLHRLKVAENCLQTNPDLLAAYKKAATDTKRVSPPGLHTQLSALRSEVEKMN